MISKKTNLKNYNRIQAPRQIILPLDFGLMINENEPVRLLDAVLEELDYILLKGENLQLAPFFSSRFLSLECWKEYILSAAYKDNAMSTSSTNGCFRALEFPAIWLLAGSLSA